MSATREDPLARGWQAESRWPHRSSRHPTASRCTGSALPGLLWPRTHLVAGQDSIAIRDAAVEVRRSWQPQSLRTSSFWRASFGAAKAWRIAGATAARAGVADV
eukprot:3592005-Pleurochrysis_carterae.AAC.1